MTATTQLRESANDAVKKKKTQVLLTVSPWLSSLPCPPKPLALFPHQSAAIRFALERSRSYLGLDAGLGKTPVAALIAAAVRAKGPVVYVSPPFLVNNVIEEFRRWAPHLKTVEWWARGFGPKLRKIDVLVVRDSMLTRERLHRLVDLLTLLDEAPTIIVDEAHRFKNPDAKRTRALLGHGKREKGLVDFFSRQIFMSGTPMPNRPMELYPILAKSVPEAIDYASQFEYGRKYCAGYFDGFAWNFSGASNMPELQSRIIAPKGQFMLRMRKALLNLPPKIEEIFVLSAGLNRQLQKLDSEIQKAYSSAEDIIKAELAASVGKSTEALHMASYRRLLGDAKAKPAAEYIESILIDTDEAVLVFAYHQSTIALLQKALDRFSPLVITGQTPTQERAELVRTFQQGKERRLFIGNYLAMGVGFTLTRATRVIFVEYSWVPADNSQASDRAHRIGQTQSVLVQYLVFPNSIDKLVLEALLRKQRVIDHV